MTYGNLIKRAVDRADRDKRAAAHDRDERRETAVATILLSLDRLADLPAPHGCRQPISRG